MGYQSLCGFDDHPRKWNGGRNCLEYGKMIEAFMELPIEKQTWITLTVGWFILLASAAMLEKFPPGECRNWARAMGVLGVLLVSLQTIHATMLAEELNRELMTQQTEAVATQIADPVRVVAVAEEYRNIVDGQAVSITRYSDGRFGPVSVATGREDRVRDPARKRTGGTAGGDGTGFPEDIGFGNVPDDASVNF